MTWFLVGDDAHSHPKMVAAGNAAIGLWTRCGSYSARYGLGGFVPAEIARAYGAKAEITALVRSGLWDAVDGGWQFHDWDHVNYSAEQAKRKRDAAAERQRRWRDKRTGETRDVTRDETRDETRESRYSNPTQPNPTHMSNHLPQLQVSGASPSGVVGDDFDQRYAAALDLAVDLELGHTHPPPRNPTAWRKAVRERIDRTDGPRISQAIRSGATPHDAIHPPRIDPAEANARSCVAGLVLTGTDPAEAFTEACSSYPAQVEVIADELAKRTGWHPPVAPVVQLRQEAQ